jgi:hypothetical protein
MKTTDISWRSKIGHSSRVKFKSRSSVGSDILKRFSCLVTILLFVHALLDEFLCYILDFIYLPSPLLLSRITNQACKSRLVPCLFIWGHVLQILLLRAGVESNPGPTPSQVIYNYAKDK